MSNLVLMVLMSLLESGKVLMSNLVLMVLMSLLESGKVLMSLLESGKVLMPCGLRCFIIRTDLFSIRTPRNLIRP